MPYESPVNNIHISLDIETLGIGPGHKIISIGMTEMFVNVNPIQFYVEIDRASQNKYNLKEDPATLAWWEKQKIAAPIGKCSIEDAMAETSDWIKRLVVDRRDLVGNPQLKPYIWAKSPSFDCAMMKWIYNVLGEIVPWDFRREMDVRTACLIANVDERDISFEGQIHNALHDARHQDLVVQECYKRLGLL